MAEGWHHFAMVLTAGVEFKVHIDGVETASQPAPGVDIRSTDHAARVVVGTRSDLINETQQTVLQRDQRGLH